MTTKTSMIACFLIFNPCPLMLKHGFHLCWLPVSVIKISSFECDFQMLTLYMQTEAAVCSLLNTALQKTITFLTTFEGKTDTRWTDTYSLSVIRTECKHCNVTFLDVGILIHTRKINWIKLKKLWIVKMDYDKIIEENPKLRRWQVIEQLNVNNMNVACAS